MLRAIGLGALAIVLAGCGTAGYQTRLFARWAGQDFAPAFQRLEDTAVARGFRPVGGRRLAKAHPDLVWAGSLEVAGEPRDAIEVVIYGNSAEQRMEVDVRCSRRGSEPTVKAKVDEITEALAAAMHELVGPGNVSEDRWSVGPYTVHSV